MSKSKLIPVGALVACAYRRGARGVVIAMNDPRAWAGSIAFPTATPNQTEVSAHVKRCQDRGDLLSDYQPVLWDFGKVYWDSKLEDVSVAATITDEERSAHA
jgi:hypothetical protein